MGHRVKREGRCSVHAHRLHHVTSANYNQSRTLAPLPGQGNRHLSPALLGDPRASDMVPVAIGTQRLAAIVVRGAQPAAAAALLPGGTCGEAGCVPTVRPCGQLGDKSG